MQNPQHEVTKKTNKSDEICKDVQKKRSNKKLAQSMKKRKEELGHDVLALGRIYEIFNPDDKDENYRMHSTGLEIAEMEIV
ncbi:hypothetical protein Tco_1246638 [Tanacetum coccineum]